MPPSCRGHQIKATSEKIERGPANPATTASSGGGGLIPQLATRTKPSGLILREETSTGSVRHPPWASERRGGSPAISAARRRRRSSLPRHTAKPRRDFYATGYTGGPGAPLPVTPAGEAAGGEGERRRRYAWKLREARGRGERIRFRQIFLLDRTIVIARYH
jgi:hypothetical protein